ASAAEDDVLADGHRAGRVKGDGQEVEAVAGVAVGIDEDVDAADVGGDRQVGGALGGGDAERIEQGVQVEDVLAAGGIAVEAVDGVVAVENAGVADGVVAARGVEAVVAGAPDEDVVAGAADERVVARVAAERVGGAVAGDQVVERVAGAGDGARARERPVLEVAEPGLAVLGQVEADRAFDRVVAAAAELAHLVAGIVDDIAVVAVAAGQAVGPETAAENVVAAGAGERVRQPGSGDRV